MTGTSDLELDLGSAELHLVHAHGRVAVAWSRSRRFLFRRDDWFLGVLAHNAARPEPLLSGREGLVCLSIFITGSAKLQTIGASKIYN